MNWDFNQMTKSSASMPIISEFIWHPLQALILISFQFSNLLHGVRHHRALSTLNETCLDCHENEPQLEKAYRTLYIRRRHSRRASTMLCVMCCSLSKNTIVIEGTKNPLKG